MFLHYLCRTSKSRLYNLFGQMDLKSYVEAKAGEWRDLEDIVVGAGEGCYCEEHSVIMIGCGHFSCIYRWSANGTDRSNMS